MVEKTTIEVRRETWRRLNAEKNPGDSFDDVIVGLLEGADRVDEVVEPGEEAIKCEHCGHEWVTSSEARRPTCPTCSLKTDRVSP